MEQEKIRKIMEETGADEATARSALQTSDGDVAIAMRIVRSYQLKEETEATGNKNDPDVSASAPGKTGQASDEDAKQEKEKQSTTQMPDADDIIKAIKEIWRKGNASRLDIERQGRTLLSVSLVVGTIGFVLAPVAALIGLGTALITEYTIKITLDDGTIINVNEFALTRKKSSEQGPAHDANHDYE